MDGCARTSPARAGKARILLAGLVLTGCSRAPARPCAVLITLDTTRADALGCLGARPGITPNLDRLARDSVIYTAAQTVAPVTLPAHASMLTGLIPPRHTVRDNALSGLPDEARTLAEIARDGGCSTAAFVSSGVLDRAWGLAQGFDTYEQPGSSSSASGSHIDELAAAETLRAAREWLATREQDRPFFLWVHLFDPHVPYRPEPRYFVQAGSNAYLGEVAAMDGALGGLLDDLRRDEAWSRTTIAVLADHGESLGEHGEATHSILCYGSTIRVPFLLRHADGRRAGERSLEIVSVVDVAPTLAEALGLPLPEAIDGISLARHPVPEDRGVYFESYVGFLNYGWSPIVGWADRRGRYLESGDRELYRPLEDPGEEENLAAGLPDETDRYRARLSEAAARPALANPRARTPDATEEARMHLRALGYAAAGDPSLALPAPLEPTGLPSPRERIQELAAYYAAVEAANGGDELRSISLLEAIVSGNPSNFAALDMLGALLAKAGRCAEAMPVLERMLLRSPERVTTLTNLGQCCEARGELERALRYYRRAEELKPLAQEQVRNLVRTLEALGRRDEARAWRDRVPALTKGGRSGG